MYAVSLDYSSAWHRDRKVRSDCGEDGGGNGREPSLPSNNSPMAGLQDGLKPAVGAEFFIDRVEMIAQRILCS